MSNIKTKAIFYAYSNNALDHLAPYAVMCHQKKMNCVVIYGEDFIKHKVKPKSNIAKIFKDLKISTYDITNFEKKGFLQIIYSFIWLISTKIEEYQFVPSYFKNKIKGLCNRIYEYLDGESLGKNNAIKLLKGTERVFVFTDIWNTKKKILNGFLSHIKGKGTIISTNHTPYHFHQTPVAHTFSSFEDIALVGNKWEEDFKGPVKRKVIIGSLRFSKKWLSILDHYSTEKNIIRENKTKVVVITHTKKHTSDWERMFNLLNKLVKRHDINLCILPHVRGMTNMQPPKELKNVWDSQSTLDVAVKESDIVIFWESSGIFEAVLRNKKIFFLSFLSINNEKYIWKNKAPSNIIMKNEIELLDALDGYDKNDPIDNSCFKEIIWPKGDPWLNVSNFFDKTFEL